MNFGILFSLIGCNTEKTEEEALYDGQDFSINCAALQEHFVTTPISQIDDWVGYWECFQENNNCSGEECLWETSDLATYVSSGDCSDAGICTIDGQEVQECLTVAETGYVTFDCSTDDEISIVANGLPDHTIENYSQSGILPPLLGSSETNVTYSLSASPVYNSDSEVFDSGGGTLAVSVNSVSIFNQFTGIGTVAVTDETVDDCGGHPANGTYHYHAFPLCGELVNNRKGGVGEHSGLTGLSLDGFPIFGPYGFETALDSDSEVVRMQSCYALTACEDTTDSACYVFDQDGYNNGTCHLDKCNGRVTVVPNDLQEALGTEIYAYYMTINEDNTPAFPYLPFCYRGDVDSGSMSGGTGMGQGPPPQ